MFKNIRLLICRNGESILNHQNKITGWIDSPLNKKGIYESFQIAEKLQKNNLIPHTIYTSNLLRSIQTGEIIKNYLKYNSESFSSWRLNEKNYGILEGLNINKANDIYGIDNINIIKNDFYAMPYFFENKPLFDSNILINNNEETNIGESSNMVTKRFLPLWNNNITPILYENKTLLIISHNEFLCSFIRFLENINVNQYKNININKNDIIYYELNNNLEIIKKNLL